MGPTTKTYKKRSTSRESLLLSTLARLDQHIFSFQQAKRVVSARGRSASGGKDNAKKILHSLMEKKWVLPLKRGLYVIVPLDVGIRGADDYIVHNFVIAGNLVTPCYIAYWSAYRAPFAMITAGRVLANILISSHKDQLSMYSKSNFIQF